MAAFSEQRELSRLSGRWDSVCIFEAQVGSVRTVGVAENRVGRLHYFPRADKRAFNRGCACL